MRGCLKMALGILAFGIAVSVPLVWKDHVSTSSSPGSSEVRLTLHGILQSSDGQCAILFKPESGELILPIFIEPFEAERLLEALRTPNDPSRHSSDRVTLALIDGLGGHLEKMRIETPEPLNSRGSLFLQGPSGDFVLPASGFLVISLALFTTTPLSIDRAGLEAWGMSRDEFDTLLRSLERSNAEAAPLLDRSQRSIDL